MQDLIIDLGAEEALNDTEQLIYLISLELTDKGLKSIE